jgi:peroxiredoxin
MTLKMRDKAPALDLPLAGGGRFKLGETPPRNFSLLIFYRGLHCHRCKGYLGEFEALLPTFGRLGVDLVAVSSDTQERAEQSKSEWQLPNLKVAYGLIVENAKSWGLFVSRGVRQDEPTIFSEPGLFLVDNQGALVLAVINSITRMRPYPKDVVETIERVLENRDSARGDA